MPASQDDQTLATDPIGNFVAGLQIYVPDPSALKAALGI